MADNKVEYIISVKDLASKVLKSIGMSADQADKSVNKLKEDSKKLGGGVANAGLSLGKLAKGFIALQAVQAGFSIFKDHILGAGMAMEQTRISFEVMIGDAEKAGKLIADLQKFGALTPFETKDLNENAKMMMNFGIESEKVIPILGMLGDVSGGNKEKLDGLTLAYSQVQSTGRLMGQDLLQMINAGFNPLKIISEKTGKSMAVLKKEMEDGAISADMVTQAFIDVTSEGGQFYGMMEKQSQTAAGRWSTLVDKLSMAGQKIGTAILPVINKIMDAISYMMEWIETNFQNIAELFRPLWEGLQPIIEGFEYLIEKMGATGESGNILSKIFNFLGGVLQIVGKLVQWIAPLIKGLIMIIADLVSWLVEAVKWIAELFGYKDKKFAEVKIADNTAFAKEIQEQKLKLLGEPGKTADVYGAKTSTSLKGSPNTKHVAQASKPTQVIINIDSLNKGGINITTQNITESANKIQEYISKALLNAVNDVNRMAGI